MDLIYWRESIDMIAWYISYHFRSMIDKLCQENTWCILLKQCRTYVSELYECSLRGQLLISIVRCSSNVYYRCNSFTQSQFYYKTFNSTRGVYCLSSTLSTMPVHRWPGTGKCYNLETHWWLKLKIKIALKLKIETVTPRWRVGPDI